MWFDTKEETERREELEKMEERAIFEHTVKAELENPGSTKVPFFTEPEKAEVLRKAIKTADEIRWRTRGESERSGDDNSGYVSSGSTNSSNPNPNISEGSNESDVGMFVVTVIAFVVGCVFLLMYCVANLIKFFNQELSEVPFTDRQFWLPTVGAGVAIAMGIFAKIKSVRRKRREKKEQEEKEWKAKEEAKRERRIKEQIESQQIFEEKKRKAMERLASKEATQAIADGFKLGCVLHRYWMNKSISEEIDIDDRYEIKRIIKKYSSLKDVAESVSYLTPYGVFKKIRGIAEKGGHAETKEFEEGVSYGISYGK